MKIRKPGKKKSIIIAIFLVIVLLTAGSMWYFFSRNDDTGDTHETEINKVEVDEEATEIPDTTEQEASAQDSSDEPVATVPEETPIDNSIQQHNDVIQRGSGGNEGSVNISITRAEAAEGIVTLTALVHGATEGICNVTFTRQGTATVTGSSPIQAGPTYYACQVDIPRNQFPTGGTWQARITVNGTSATEEVRL